MGTPPLQSSPQLRNKSHPQYSQALHSKVLTTPELKPAALSVPLPSGPLTANILDSLEGAPGSGKARILDPVLGQAPPTMLGMDKALSQQQLQKVIAAQKTQIALLQEISQYVSKSKTMGVAESAPSGHYKGVGLPAATAPSERQGHVTRQDEGGAGGVSSRVVETFDYGNHSNKALEFKAVQQLEKDVYYHPTKDGRWP